MAVESPIAAHLEVQRIRPIDRDEDGLQQVMPIWPTPDDMQEQVQLGWRGNIEKRANAHGRSSLT